MKFETILMQNVKFPKKKKTRWKDLLFFLWLLFLLFFLPSTFRVHIRKEFATYPFENSCMISVTKSLFRIDAPWPNTFPIRSYLPKHWKPCYHLNSETVRDKWKLNGGKCWRTHSGHFYIGSKRFDKSFKGHNSVKIWTEAGNGLNSETVSRKDLGSSPLVIVDLWQLKKSEGQKIKVTLTFDLLHLSSE